MTNVQPIRRLLVANRGEIARRIFRTARDLGISTVAVFSEPDRIGLFVAEADEAVALGGITAQESYLRADAIIEAARRTGADAVHPGYGFLAENADFAAAVVAAGLTWIGPRPETIAAMGSKIRARELLAGAGVPVLPAATLGTGDAGLAAAVEEIGYPVLVKASAGGGGKGMRIVRAGAELTRSVEAARREAAAAFGDDSIFVERYLEDPRHVEIQIMGDLRGTVVALFERDCSVQRRHQKVVEESPSPVVDGALRAEMCAAAVAAAEAIGYVGAGTVEFLVDRVGRFFFLEVNTRLQVEHPVTEAVTGLDLVRLQIAIAEGHPLPPEVLSVLPFGHAIEARIYAEDPARGFLPTVGRLHRFRFPGDVRVDSGVGDGSVVSEHYDPMLAKVVAHAPTRREAARKLAAALEQAEIHGITTNRDFLVRLLRLEEFLTDGVATDFLDQERSLELMIPLVDAEEERRAAVAAALADQAQARGRALVLRHVPSGWRNVPSQAQSVTYAAPSADVVVEYRFDRGGALVELRVDGTLLPARLHVAGDDLVDLELDAVRRRFRVARAGDRVYVNSSRGQVELLRRSRFPAHELDSVSEGSLLAPMPGSVLRVDVAEGQAVERGQPLLVLEAMKMEHEVVAPTAGVVRELLVSAGDAVDSGAILAVIDGGDGVPEGETNGG